LGLAVCFLAEWPGGEQGVIVCRRVCDGSRCVFLGMIVWSQMAPQAGSENENEKEG